MSDALAYLVAYARSCDKAPSRGSDKWENAVRSDLAELDRLRARVAELEAAGDVLAVEASWTSLDVRCGPLDDAVSDWRAVRGEGSE